MRNPKTLLRRNVKSTLEKDYAGIMRKQMKPIKSYYKKHMIPSHYPTSRSWYTTQADKETGIDKRNTPLGLTAHNLDS